MCCAVLNFDAVKNLCVLKTASCLSCIFDALKKCAEKLLKIGWSCKRVEDLKAMLKESKYTAVNDFTFLETGKY